MAPIQGHGPTFIIGYGNDIHIAAIEIMRPPDRAHKHATLRTDDYPNRRIPRCTSVLTRA